MNIPPVLPTVFQAAQVHLKQIQVMDHNGNFSYSYFTVSRIMIVETLIGSPSNPGTALFGVWI